MVEKWKKQLLKFDKKWEIKQIVKDILTGNLTDYKIKKLDWKENLFRIRKGKIRIIFKKVWNDYFIVKIQTRWDVYKWL